MLMSSNLPAWAEHTENHSATELLSKTNATVQKVDPNVGEDAEAIYDLTDAECMHYAIRYKQ